MRDDKKFLLNQMIRKPLESLPTLMKTDEFGMLVGMSPVRVSRLCNAGLLPAIKIGKEWRISRDVLIEKLRGEKS